MDPVEVSVSDGTRPEVGVCERCAGVFIEFVDGDPRELAERLMAAPAVGLPPASLTGRAPACPDCGIAMEPRRYLGTGPMLVYCSACVSLFLPRAQLAELAAFRYDEGVYAPEPSWLRALWQWLLRHLGG